MSFTEQFDVGSGFSTLGQFSVTFQPLTESILGTFVAPAYGALAGGFVESMAKCHLCVTPGKLGAHPSSTNVLGQSIWTGKIYDFDFGAPGEPWKIGGTSALAWIGDDDGKGPLSVALEYPVGSEYTGNLPDFLLAMMVAAPSGTNGIYLDATAASVPTGSYTGIVVNAWDIARTKMQKMCSPGSVEYVFTHDLKCLFAGNLDSSNTVFQWTPKVIFGPDIATGKDAGLSGYTAVCRPRFSYRNEAGGYWASNGAGTQDTGAVGALSLGSASVTRNPYDVLGASGCYVDKWIGGSDDTYNSAASPAPILGQKFCRSDTITLDVDAALLRTELKTGDYVWLCDDFHGIKDPANTVRFQGARHPVRYRVTSIETPITRDMGVYVIHQIDGTNTVQPVHDQIVPETGPVRVTLATSSPMTDRRLVYGLQWRPSYTDYH